MGFIGCGNMGTAIIAGKFWNPQNALRRGQMTSCCTKKTLEKVRKHSLECRSVAGQPGRGRTIADIFVLGQ